MPPDPAAGRPVGPGARGSPAAALPRTSSVGQPARGRGRGAAGAHAGVVLRLPSFPRFTRCAFSQKLSHALAFILLLSPSVLIYSPSVTSSFPSLCPRPPLHPAASSDPPVPSLRPLAPSACACTHIHLPLTLARSCRRQRSRTALALQREINSRERCACCTHSWAGTRAARQSRARMRRWDQRLSPLRSSLALSSQRAPMIAERTLQPRPRPRPPRHLAQRHPPTAEAQLTRRPLQPCPWVTALPLPARSRCQRQRRHSTRPCTGLQRSFRPPRPSPSRR